MKEYTKDKIQKLNIKGENILSYSIIVEIIKIEDIALVKIQQSKTHRIKQDILERKYLQNGFSLNVCQQSLTINALEE